MNTSSILRLILACLLLLSQTSPIAGHELDTAVSHTSSNIVDAPIATSVIPPGIAGVAGEDLPTMSSAGIPNYVVRGLRPDTNPTLNLGGWTVFNTTNSTIGGNAISSIALDSIGRPWVGLQPFAPGGGVPVTGGGLSVYNSNSSWTTYFSPTLVNNWVSAVGVDARDQIWVGSMTYYDPGTGTAPAGGVAMRNTAGAWTKYLVGSSVTSIATVGNEVWIGLAGGGIARFDASTDPPTPLSPFTVGSTGGGLANDNINTIKTTDVNSFVCGHNPQFWVGHESGVSRYEYGLVSISPVTCGWRWTNYSISRGNPLPSTSITAIAIDTRHRIWFGSDCCYFDSSTSANGLTMLDGTTWITYTVDNSGLTYNRIHSLAADQQGRVWIGQTDFLILPNSPSHAHDSLSPATLPPQLTLNVFEDGGLTDRSDDRWCYYAVGSGSCASPTPPTGLPSVHVSAMAASAERFWFGTGDIGGSYGAGIAALTLNWKTYNTSNSSLNGISVTSLWLDASTGQAWLGGPNGINRFDGTNWRFYALSSPGYFSSGIHALHRDEAGRLWAGEGLFNGDSFGAVWRYQPNSDTWQQVLVPGTGDIKGLSSDLTTNKRLWVATGNGAKVFNVNSSSWVTLTTVNSPLVSNNVNAVTHDNAGQMWLGTDQGISIYTGARWLTYTVSSTAGGLINNDVRALAVDGLGRMWVGTTAGASVISGTTWTTYTVATTNGGLRSNVIRSIALDSASRVWFATDNGMSVLDGTRWSWFNSYNSGLADDYTLALAADSQDGIWIGTNAGLSVRGTLPGLIGLPAPTITSFTPSSGPVNTQVTINGTNFYFGSVTTNRVYFSGPNGTYAEASVIGQSGNASVGSLTVRVPFNAVKGPIYVSHGGGGAQTLSDFSPLPTYTDYSPTAAGIGFNLVVFGANLGGASRLRFSNGIESTNLEPMASNRLRIKIPANAASGDLTLLTDGGSIVLSPPFTFAALCPQKPDNTCAGSGDSGAIEVNQGLPDDMYPLVTGKETLVRVYVGSNTPDAFVAIDSGLLTISGPGSVVTRTALIPQHIFNNTVRSFSELRNVNFFLDGTEIPTSGMYSFTADLRANGASVYSATAVKAIQATKDLRFVDFTWSNGQVVSPTTQVWDEIASEQKAIATLARVYPVRRGVGSLANCPACGVTYLMQATAEIIPTRFYSGTPSVPNVMCDKIGGFSYAVQTQENSRAWWNKIAALDGVSPFFDVAGFVPWRLNPVSGLGCGLADTKQGSFTPGNLQGLGGKGDNRTGAVLSQEVAHNFGLVMTGTVTSDGTGHSINEIVLAPAGGVTETRGFNLATRRSIIEPHTVMQGSCCTGIESNDTQLFEPADFALLMSNILALMSTGSSAKAAEATTTQPVFNLVGAISLSGTVTRFDSRLLPPNVPITPLSNGPYYIVFLDASDRVLAADGFAVPQTMHEGTLDPAPFSVSRPMPTGTAKVQIRQNAISLAEYHISPNPPSLSVTAPNGGSFGANDDVTASWSATDLDGDPLTYSLLYSRDDGATWQVLQSHVTGTSIVWNTLLAGGTAQGSFSRLKVIASDGFNTTEALSNRFVVAGKPPIVSIIAPMAPTPYIEDQTVEFQGLATDLEDGMLPPGSLVWSSDRGGILGNGPAISTTLSVGTHLITLTGTDSDGNITRDSLIIKVESDFDGDGIPDSQEPDNFWNPNDAGDTIGGVTKLDYARGIRNPPTFAPGLFVNPPVLNLTAESGMSSTLGVITIQSTDSNPLMWTAANTQSWLGLSATSGSTLGVVDATVNTIGLKDGVYNDQILVQSGPFSKTVPVTLSVTSRHPLVPLVYLPLVRR